jgi:hypothetical protein
MEITVIATALISGWIAGIACGALATAVWFLRRM